MRDRTMNRSFNRPDLHRPVNNAIPFQKRQIVILCVAITTVLF